MKKTTTLFFVLFVILMRISTTGYATHLMGGSLNYEYLGLNSGTGLYDYRVTITIYRYCDNGATLLPTSLDIGVYQDNPANPTGNKQRILSSVLPLITIQSIVPPNANDTCTFTPNVCVEEGVYQAILSVTSNTTGYYFISDRCCRNNNIINLFDPGNTGQAYYAYAPAPSVVNSSPTFAVAPVPFVCAMDTTTILNQAYDPDGDSLVYTFVVPYNGISGPGNPNPNPPVNYTWPIPVVTYAPTYSLNAPFGAGGVASMNSTTGLATYYAPNQGFYVLAFEIKEYRNGVLIGVSRRDLQVIVITCPVNPNPVLTINLQTSYTINEGETLCFNTSFSDPNGDSIFINHTGDIFDPLITNPPATFTNASGLGVVTGNFCWTPSCSQGQSNPYQFSVISNDNGCPAKTTNVVYSITVLNTPSPGAITGPDTLCLNNANGVFYTVPNSTGNTHDWWVTNGSINGSSTGTSVDVNFNSPGQATINVVTVNPFGCSSDTITKLVEIVPLPSAIAGPDIQFCSGGSATLGAPSVPGNTYSWSPATGLSSTTTSNPTVTISNSGTGPVTNTYILTVTNGGCSNSDTVVVTTNPLPVAAAGPDVAICSGNTVSIGSTPVGGAVYSWSPSTGLSNPAVANPTVNLVNSSGVPDSFYYVVQVQNGFNCIAQDSVLVIVNPVPVAQAGTNIIFCSGGSGSIGSAATGGFSYNWTPSTGLSSNTSSNPTVTLTNNTGVNDTLNYIVTVSAFGCSDQDTVQVIVKPNPVSNAGNNGLLCGADTLQLGTGNTPGYTYSWSPSAGLNSTTISNPTLIISNTTNLPDTLVYIVTTTLNGCTSTDTVQIISGPAPVANAGPDAILCSGQTLTLGGAGVSGYIYSWTPSTGLNNTGISAPTATLTNSTQLPVTVTYIVNVNAYGCTDTDTVSIVVKPLPVSIAGTDATLCGGDSLILGTSNTPGYTYQWTPSTGLNSTTISNPTAVFVNNTGTPSTVTYTVTTTLNGCTTTDSVTITINPLPQVTAAASPTVLCLGQNTTLVASGALNYTWALLSNPQVTISTDSNFVVSPSTTTTYILNGTTGLSCSFSDTITITVNPLPPVQISTATTTICDGDSISLQASGATSYSWSVLGGAALGTSNPITVSPSVSTSYVVTGTDGNLCVNSDTISITVNPAATLSGANGTLSVCPGVTGVQYWVNNPNPNSNYNWVITNGTITSGQGTDTITVDWPSVSGTGTITVTEVTNLGCQSEPIVLNITINVILTPVAPAGPTTFCANTAQGIPYNTINTPGSTYNWLMQGGNVVSGNGTSNVIVDWTSAGPQTVYIWYEETSTTATNVCFGSSDTLAVTLNPVPVTSAISGPPAICVSDTGTFTVVNTSTSSYSWTINGGNILSGNGTNTIVADWTVSGTAVITVQETNSFGCIGDPVTFNVTVNPLPAANAGTDVGVCIGQGVQLNASGGVSYFWTPSTGLNNVNIVDPIASPVVSTVYSVLVTDANGCKNSDSLLVTVNPLPVITLTQNSAICIGDSITLNAGGGTIYQWSPASSLNNANTGSPVASPLTTTTYTVIVTDNNTCVDSATVTITVNPLPVATASADTIICDGTSAMLIAGGGVSYSWSPATGLNNPSIYNPVATPSSNTVYTVTVTDANGCMDDEQVLISLNDQPVASFLIDPDLGAASCNGVETNLINTSYNALNYLWIFDDGTTTTDENPQHVFNINNSNIITLIGYNNMCSDTSVFNYNDATVALLLKNIPNVFTPNNDGKNDCYELGDLLDFRDCSSITIYDRWGEVVFRNEPGKDCWNGKRNNIGSELPLGTYFLTVVIAGEKHKSTITLLR